MGWGQPVRTNGWVPDGRWFGDTPRVLVDVHGAEAETLIPKVKAAVDHFNETLIAVPIEMLRLARTQFNYLSDGFASSGDVILQTMSEIGGFAIEQALTGKRPE